MSQPLGFEIPYMIGGIPSSGDREGCAQGFGCDCGYSGCADDYSCSTSLAISAVGAGIGVVIAIVPTNAAPG